jgi:hypothetical protein
MASMQVETAALSIAPEVAAFAAEQGVTTYLPAVIEMTRRIFPNSPLHVWVSEDPEIANDRHLVLEVNVSGLVVEQLVAGQQSWTAEIFQHCPSTHVCVFRLEMM